MAQKSRTNFHITLCAEEPYFLKKFTPFYAQKSRTFQIFSQKSRKIVHHILCAQERAVLSKFWRTKRREPFLTEKKKRSLYKMFLKECYGAG